MTEPRLWGPKELSEFMGLSEDTILRRVVHQRGFPKGIRPTGGTRGELRWWSDEVMTFYRQKAA